MAELLSYWPGLVGTCGQAPATDWGTQMTPAALVLVVEDEELIQMLVEEALTPAGYEVLLAVSGTEAITRLEDDPATIQALVTDVRLGAGSTGWDVARRARELIHDLPVVYMTADSGADWSSQGVPNSVLVIKPFAMNQVVTAVSALLNDVAAKRAT
jgi:DNA-binding response OmpR family regulator